MGFTATAPYSAVPCGCFCSWRERKSRVWLERGFRHNLTSAGQLQEFPSDPGVQDKPDLKQLYGKLNDNRGAGNANLSDRVFFRVFPTTPT